MNVTYVKDTVLPEFLRKISNLYTLLEEIPTKIALYDTENSQIDAFRGSALNLKNEVDKLVNEIVGEINSHMETEINRMFAAKTQSANTLNN